MNKFNTRRSEEQAYKALLLHTTRRMWLLLRESTGVLEIFRTQSGVQLKDLYRDKRLPKHVPVRLWKQQINRHLLQHILVLAKTKLPPFWNSRSRDIHFSARAKCPKILDILTSQIQPVPCTRTICRGPWRADGTGNEVTRRAATAVLPSSARSTANKTSKMAALAGVVSHRLSEKTSLVSV